MGPDVSLDGTRPRKSSNEHHIGPSGGPTTFFLARESDLNRPSQTSNPTAVSDRSPVRTLKETLEEASRSNSTITSHTGRNAVRSNSRRRSTIKPRSIEGLRQEALSQSSSPPRPPSEIPIHSLVPSQAGSLPSSPQSMSSRSVPKSDDELTQDDSGSQAVASSEDEDEDDDAQSFSVQNSAPQLIMPSIKMPSRRPFTARGKELDRFKIMVAGSSGAGKTSLIKSIVQLCEDIVHVDPLATNLPLRSTSHARQRSTHFHETYASTKPYPTWWSDIDDSRVLKRRKSIGDSVLERNICFVDVVNSGRIESALYYLEQQIVKSISSATHATADLTNMLSGRGGPQVDLVLYLISHATLKMDSENILRLSSLANVVPLISRSDLLSTDQIADIKSTIDASNTALPQIPALLSSQNLEDSKATAPYLVSSANGPDFDNMDASLLMSPEYVQPLLPSELGLLIDQIFDPNTISYLRHTASKKLVYWYRSEPKTLRELSPSIRSPPSSTLNSPLQTSMSQSGVLAPLTSELSLNTSNSFALAKVADHAQREERLAQVRLSKWASDLQLSLQRERERYESIARGERALWLVQRMGEEVREGQILPVGNSQAVVKSGDRVRLLHRDPVTYQVHDPLGLLRWQDDMRSRTWITLQIMGGFGVVGGIALWIAKTWGFGSTLADWAKEWSWNEKYVG